MNDRKLTGAFFFPEAIAGVLAALGIPVAVVFGQILLAALLGFVIVGVFLRFKRRAIKRRRDR